MEEMFRKVERIEICQTLTRVYRCTSWNLFDFFYFSNEAFYISLMF